MLCYGSDMNILSVQSHVSVGHAGNASAVFPLQRMGINVWPVYTVLFSNSGESRKGSTVSARWVKDILAGIDALGVMAQCNAILSGYLGEPGTAKVLADAVSSMKQQHPDLLYCCDPVMGDDGRVYVDEDLPALFLKTLIPLADMVTPNQFELELLTGCSISNLKSILEAGRKLLAAGPEVVLVTSVTVSDMDSDVIGMIALTEHDVWYVQTPFFEKPGAIGGSGDVATAVFLARYLLSKDLKLALEYTAGVMFALFEYACQQGSRDLLLIEAQDKLMNPPQFNAQRLRNNRR